MSRKFNGLLYKEADATPTKPRADAIADTWRKKGYNARIVKNKNSFTIYVRKKATTRKAPAKRTGRKATKGKKYTLAEIRAANKKAGHFFFSRDTMRHFRGAKNSVIRTPDGVHYVKVSLPESMQYKGRKAVYYKFNPKNGHLDYVKNKPEGLR
jgi:hypothetical protein